VSKINKSATLKQNVNVDSGKGKIKIDIESQMKTLISFEKLL